MVDIYKYNFYCNSFSFFNLNSFFYKFHFFFFYNSVAVFKF